MIIPLHACCSEDIDIVGNKAKNLCWLIQNGFKCPDGFVIPSTLFSDSIKLSLEKKKEEIERTRYLDNYFKNLGESIMRILSGGSIDYHWFTADIKHDLKERLEQVLTKKKMRKIKDTIDSMSFQYAYGRSSTNYGDSTECTYAGAFESIPFVAKGSDDIITKRLRDVIIEIVMSIFSEMAFIYAVLVHRIGIKEYLDNVTISVIIQEMKNSTPYLSGQIDLSQERIKFQMTHGLGEGVMKLIYSERGGGITKIIYSKTKEEKISSCWTVIWSREKDNLEQLLFETKDGGYYTVNTTKGFGEDFVEPFIKIEESEIIEIVKKLKEEICESDNIRNYGSKNILLEFTIYTKGGEIYLTQIRPKV